MRLALLFAAAALGVAHGHRLDEYLQATVISIEPEQIRGELRLTPGVAVLPQVMAALDLDGNGDISAVERQAYARRVIGDLRLAIDGRPQQLTLSSVRFPPLAQMREGLGAIEIGFTAALAPHGSHQLSFTNLHQRPISVYLVNCLLPGDAATHIDSQSRSYEQSDYQVTFTRRRSVQWSEWLLLAFLPGLLFLRYLSVNVRHLAQANP